MGRPRRGEGPGGAPLDGRERERWERALAAALRGPSLSRSARGRELLRYLVRETQAGRRHRITGVTIAQDVLGRDASFDSETDAIVRVQMRRLRVQLAEDQAAGAPGDAPWIAIPKGAYRPELTEPRPPSTRADPTRADAAIELAEPAPPWPGAAPARPEPSEEPREPPVPSGDPKEPKGPDDRPAKGPRRLLLGALAALEDGLAAVGVAAGRWAGGRTRDQAGRAALGAAAAGG